MCVYVSTVTFSGEISSSVQLTDETRRHGCRKERRALTTSRVVLHPRLINGHFPDDQSGRDGLTFPAGSDLKIQMFLIETTTPKKLL